MLLKHVNINFEYNEIQVSSIKTLWDLLEFLRVMVLRRKFFRIIGAEAANSSSSFLWMCRHRTREVRAGNGGTAQVKH